MRFQLPRLAFHACYVPRKRHQKLAFLGVSHSAFGACVYRKLSASASSHPSLFLAAFITNIAESNFRYTQGAEAILNLAVADELEGRSGQFYNGLRPSKANPQAYDARERLRALSLKLTGLA